MLNTTTITTTHYNGDRQEYIINDLEGHLAGSRSNIGINKAAEVVVKLAEGEVKEYDIS